jgi:hypothetical protein
LIDESLFVSQRFALPPPPLKLPPCRHHATADVTLACCRHRRRRAFALPPSLLTLPLLPRRRQATADVALSRCRHCRSLRAAATALPPSRCAPPPRFTTLPLTSRWRAAANANIALLRCRYRR